MEEKTLKEQLIAFREKWGVSQKEIAEGINGAISTISLIESGKEFSKKTQQKIKDFMANYEANHNTDGILNEIKALRKDVAELKQMLGDLSFCIKLKKLGTKK